MPRLIAALGNPGLEYERTRHNIGWDILKFCDFYSDLNWKDKYKGLYASLDVSGDKVHFIKPMTFMNLSGESVSAVARFFKVEVKDILVLQDEIDLPFGTIAFKKGGGLAGHNGLRSIKEKIGSQDFLRLRLGVGRPEHGSVSSWVLSKYRGDDEIALDTYLKCAAGAINTYIEKGYDRAANMYSRKNCLEI